jgi:hypothetical protein
VDVDYVRIIRIIDAFYVMLCQLTTGVLEFFMTGVAAQPHHSLETPPACVDRNIKTHPSIPFKRLERSLIDQIDIFRWHPLAGCSQREAIFH